ncbi:flagellar biosynthesis protein FliP [Paenibacillus sp. LBL]|jgi:flagellar biosynthesis protein FliP|nr:flagellar biosynthesis protein FliP [Paenibacillus sp. LBL]
MLSCCGGHHQENSHQSQSSYHASKWHHWIMTLCCALPIVVVVLMVLIRAFQGEPTNNILIGILLICPLFHMIFMPLMNKIHHRRTSKE